MSVFSHIDFDHHEQVVYGHDKTSGLRAIIAIHNSNLGPALGGCRMWNYANDDEALRDVLRLSRGMTYKSALANLPLGGGKAVIIGDPHTGKSAALFQAMGDFVDSLGGRYITAADSGTGVAEMQIMAERTRHVSGAELREAFAGGTRNGDPSPSTAYGVFIGIQTAVKHRLGRDDLHGLKVAIQGVGQVGFDLARQLKAAGAELWVTDIVEANVRRAVEQLGATAVPQQAILGWMLMCSLPAPWAALSTSKPWKPCAHRLSPGPPTTNWPMPAWRKPCVATSACTRRITRSMPAALSMSATNAPAVAPHSSKRISKASARPWNKSSNAPMRQAKPP